MDPVFDRGHLERVTLGDADLQKQLLKAFLGQAVEIREGVHAGVRCADDLREQVHRLRGSCQFVGALRMDEFLTSVENESCWDDLGWRQRTVLVILAELDGLTDVLRLQLDRT